MWKKIERKRDKLYEISSEREREQKREQKEVEKKKDIDFNAIVLKMIQLFFLLWRRRKRRSVNEVWMRKKYPKQREREIEREMKVKVQEGN